MERKVHLLLLTTLFWVLALAVSIFILIFGAEDVQAGRIRWFEGFFSFFGLMVLGLVMFGLLTYLLYLFEKKRSKNKR